VVDLKGIVLPSGWELPQCNHPIEKWCSNCDRDYVTYDKIPHFRKYKEFHTWTHEEFDRLMNKEKYERNNKSHGK